ncbi:MAG: glycosyltransferase family 4 protein [bacterium]|nr:glycosyltransferase family 4 protein [bacterium]
MLKKVLFFDHSAQFGGAERSLLDIIAGLKKTDNTFVTSNETILARFKKKGIRCILFPMPPKIVNKKRNAGINLDEICIIIKLILRFINLLRKEKPDLVYTNSQKAHLIGGVSARILQIPVYVHFRDIFNKKLFSKIWTFGIYLIANKLISISNAVAKQFPASGKVKIIYNGIDIKLDSHKNTKKQNSCFVVGYAGQIARWKGIEYFIQSASMIMQRKNIDIKFIIVGGPIFGDEEYLKELKDLTKKLKVEENIQFKGVVENAINEILEFDILVHPSVLPEPFGRVLIEAGILEKPVVATNIGAIPEIVVNGETGIIVPVKNASAIADGIIKLFDNPKFACLLGQNANKRVKEYFNLTNTIISVQNIVNG